MTVSQKPTSPGYKNVKVDDAALEAILHSVREERYRQALLQQEGRFEYTCADTGLSPGNRLAVLVEEVGEVGRTMLKELTLVHDGEPIEDGDLDKELIQVAAIAIAWVEGRATRRRSHGKPEH